MIRRVALMVAVAALAAPALADNRPSAAPPIAAAPEARPFGDPAPAQADYAAALARSAKNGHRIILVFGANWCHDSRALAGWFATPRFAAMLKPRYEIVWIDVGDKDRNIDLARSFGLDGIKGTPTVLVLDARDHKPLNLADAPSWRNASMRGEDAIYAYFASAPVTTP